MDGVAGDQDEKELDRSAVFWWVEKRHGDGQGWETIAQYIVTTGYWRVEGQENITTEQLDLDWVRLERVLLPGQIE